MIPNTQPLDVTYSSGRVASVVAWSDDGTPLVHESGKLVHPDQFARELDPGEWTIDLDGNRAETPECTDDLPEVGESIEASPDPVISRTIGFHREDMQRARRIADREGVSVTLLLHRWFLERLQREESEKPL